MPPQLALLIWFVALVALLWFDPAKDSKVSMALWVPLTWFFFVATRLPSQWLGAQVGQAAQAMEDGNPVDRTINSLLILMAICILFSRSFQWGDFIFRNRALMVFLMFALISATWSDFPLISLKRWFRDFGNYLMILVVISDRRGSEAMRSFLRRLCYLLIPLSILLLKYFPEIGKQYDSWTGAQMNVGPTTGKNLLGVVALVSVLFFFWDIVERWPERKTKAGKRIFLLNIVFLWMSFWVLDVASSTTAYVCVGLGAAVMLAAHMKIFRRNRRLLIAAIPSVFCLYLILAFGFGMVGSFAGAVGKDPTLTDRTKIWAFLLSEHTNPLLGCGYETFWLGSRLQRFWNTAGLGMINEAHSGYLEVYLQLGLIGVGLLVAFIISGYRKISKGYRSFSGFSSFSLAIWIVLLFYSVTEAGFRTNLIWLSFLLGTITVQQRVIARAPSQAESEEQALIPPQHEFQHTF